MKIREYLRIQAAEIIIRVNIAAMHPAVIEGHYEIKLDEEWISVYVSIPRIETAARLVHMELSSADERLHALLRVYRRVTEEVSLQLRDFAGGHYQVDYNSVQKLSRIYVTGVFLTEPGDKTVFDLIPFRCRLSDGTEVRGNAGETTRQRERALFLYTEDSTPREIYRLLKELERGELLLEEILSLEEDSQDEDS